MLTLPPKFKQALGNGTRTSLFPIVRIYKNVRIDKPDTWDLAPSVNLSIKEINLDVGIPGDGVVNIQDIEFSPLLLTSPSFTSSADIINRKYTISKVSLSISNALYKGEIFSDSVQTLLNAVCQVYFCSNGITKLEDCLLVYTGTIRRYSQSGETISLSLEDVTEQMLSTKIPSSTIPASNEDGSPSNYREEDIGKPYPMVYGYVDRSPLLPQGSGFDEHGEMLDQLNVLHIDKPGKQIKGTWEEPNMDNYGNPYINENHPLVLEGWIDKVSFLSTYSDDFMPLSQSVPKQWGEDNIDLDIQSYFYSPATDNESANITINHEAMTATESTAFPSRVYRPIVNTDFFTYCDNVQDADRHAVNRIYGFANYESDVGDWKPWIGVNDFADTAQAYYSDWYEEGGTFSWWQPTACNENVNGPVNSNVDDYWLSAYPETEGKFPVDRIQNGSLTDGIYLAGANPDGERPQYNKSGGSSVNLMFKKNVASFPCVTKIIYQAEYHSFDGMQLGDIANDTKFCSTAKFWTGEGLPESFPLGQSVADWSWIAGWDYALFSQLLNAEQLMDPIYQGLSIEFPNIPNAGDGWYHVDHGGEQNYTEDTIRNVAIQVSDIMPYFENTTAYNEIYFGIPELIKFGTGHGDDIGFVSALLFNLYVLQDVYVSDIVNKPYFADIRGRTQSLSDNLIHRADLVLKDILQEELNYEGDVELSDTDVSWQNSFTLSEQKEAKKVFEDLFKSSLMIPSFNSKGQFKFIYLIQDIDDISEYPVVDAKDILKYSFQLSKLDDIYSSVNVKYKMNYGSNEFDKQTGYELIDDAGNLYDNYGAVTEELSDNDREYYDVDYYGLTYEETKLEVESEYIRDDNTARLLQKSLVSWYANQHLIIKIDLPVSYMALEVGDYIRFDDLIGGKLAFGYDYSENTNKNGQLVYPLFFITKINKSLDKISLEGIQIHRGEYGFYDGWELPDPDEDEDEEEIEPGEPYITASWTEIDGVNNELMNNPIIQVQSNVDWDKRLYITFASEEFEYEFFWNWQTQDETIEQGNQDTHIPWFHDLVDYNVEHYQDGEDDNWSGLLYLFPEHNLPEGVYVNGYIEIRNDEIDEEQWAIMPFVWAGSNQQILPGDTTLDGVVNVLDVVLTVQYALGNEDLSDEQIAAADINNDGGVNILDVVQIVNFILSGGG